MLRLALSLGSVLLALAACHSMAPPNGPNSTCRSACEARAGKTCSARECRRGCEMSLDRIVEHESDSVIACVARSHRGCSDAVWAECSVLIGNNADGGPAPPTTETFPDED